MNPIIRIIASSPQKRRYKALHRALYGQGFGGSTANRLLILFERNRISYASVFPFIEYKKDFRARFDVEIKCIPIDQALQHGIPDSLSTATHVIGQTWLTDPKSRHEQLATIFDRMPNNVTTAYLDSFANNDIRWAGVFDSAQLYFKKSLFKDLTQFTRATYGHTNLSEYYGRLYGLNDEMTDWDVPQSMLSKLRLAPNFLTSPDLSASFSDNMREGAYEKDIDLHARLGGVSAKGWYGEMRRHAADVVDKLNHLRIAKGTGVSRKSFMQELKRSIVCFSPFGYGELCWRDLEAIAAGAVLVKPDMSHLRTDPDLYRDGQTYIACRWDFSDLPDKVRDILADKDKQIFITGNARRIAREYIETAGPVSTYSDLFIN